VLREIVPHARAATGDLPSFGDDGVRAQVEPTREDSGAEDAADCKPVDSGDRMQSR